MSPRTYVLCLSLFGIIFGAIVVAINWVVDPYAVFSTRRIAGFSEYKVDINNFTRLSKRYQPEEGRYNALILGNSRVELGIDPAHSCFEGEGLTAYNLGLPGAGVRTQLLYALNVMHQQHIEQIFMSVDFSDFIAATPPAVAARPAALLQGASELRYLPRGEPNPDFFRFAARDYYKSLFTLNALVSSVKTVLGQSRRAPDRDRLGFNPARDFGEAVRVEGPAALFEQKLHELNIRYSKPWYLRDANGQLDQSFDDVSDFLDIAAQQGIEVHLFTNPFHEKYWGLLQRHQLMPLYKDWFESLVGLARQREIGDLTLWNFSRDSSYIHESLPGEGANNDPLQWFWEPAHYRKELGDLMIESMLSDSCGTGIVFGRKLLELATGSAVPGNTP